MISNGIVIDFKVRIPSKFVVKGTPAVRSKFAECRELLGH